MQKLPMIDALLFVYLGLSLVVLASLINVYVALVKVIAPARTVNDWLKLAASLLAATGGIIAIFAAHSLL
jgi:cell division protein FtsB